MPEALWIGGSTSATDLEVRALRELQTLRSAGIGVRALDGAEAPLWEPMTNGSAGVATMDRDGAPLWEPLVNGSAGACTMDHDGAALWEPGPDMWAKWPEPHLRGVDFQRTGEVDALMPTLATPLVPSVLKPMAPVPTPPAGVRTPDEPDASSSGGLLLASVGRLAVRTYLGARRAAGDPRLTGVLRAAPSVAYFLARSRARSAGAAHDDTVVPVRATPVLALQAYLDEVLIAVLRHPELLPKESDCTSAAQDLVKLRAMFAREGWLERPAAYHRDPPPPYDIEVWDEHRGGMGYERVAFSSGWEPNPLEPGWARWMAHEANQTVHAWVSRVPGRYHRSWLVCAHGLGMGNNPAMDLRAFRASQLGHRGINVVIPVLPLHGPRASGRGRGEDLMTIDMVDSLHGVAQAAWDVRRIIRWLREEQGAEQVGVIGYSLGGLVASIVAALEDDLACVIAGIPVVDLPHLVRRHSPPDIAQMAGTSGVLGPAADEVHRVVSPLAMECRVPLERRFIFAGLADRMSTFGHARRLWMHWDRPAFESYPGGHVGFFWSAAVKRFVDEALRRSYTNAAAA